MTRSRVLKINVVFLAVLILVLIVSTVAIYKGNNRFFGIVGIAILALAIVIWRIFTIGSEEKKFPEPESLKIAFDPTTTFKKVPPKK